MSESPSKPIIELATQSRDTTNAAFDLLLPEVAKIASQMGNPQAAMGLVQALYRIATALAYSTIGTGLDVRLRTPEDAAALASAHWKAATHLNSLVMHELKRQGLKVPPELARLNNASPPPATAVEAQEAVDAASAPNPQEYAEKIAAMEVGEAPQQQVEEKPEKQEGSAFDMSVFKGRMVRGGQS